MNTRENQFFTALSYSYITYIHEHLNLLNNSLYASLQYLDQETADIVTALRHIFLELPELCSQGPGSKETQASKVLEFRAVLERKYQVLNAYQRELQHLTTSLYFSENLSELSDSSKEFLPNDPSVDFDTLIADCLNFVFEIPQIHTRQERANLILPFIPIKMTKENYLEYVKKSISYIAIEPTPENAALLTSVLKQLFDGNLCPFFGEDFGDLAAMLFELKENLGTEDFLENSELLEETLGSSLEIIHTLYKITGSLSNLLLLEELDFSTLTALHISFYDFYHTVKKLLVSDEDRELFLSSLPEQVGKIRNVLEINYNKVYIEHPADPIRHLMHTYLSLDASHIFNFDIKKSPELLPAVWPVLQQFLDQLKEHLLSLPVLEQKLRMQYFMSNIPFIMSPKHFQLYLQQAFSGSSSHNLTSARYLTHIFQEHAQHISDDLHS